MIDGVALANWVLNKCSALVAVHWPPSGCWWKSVCCGWNGSCYTYIDCNKVSAVQRRCLFTYTTWLRIYSCAHDCPEPVNNSECPVSLDNPAANDDCIRRCNSIFGLHLNIQSKQHNSPAHVCCSDHTALVLLWTERYWSYAAAALVASSASSTGMSRLPRILSVIAETPSLISTTKSPAQCMQHIRSSGKQII